VLDARRRLFEAQRDYARSRYDYLINIVRLESASGGLKSEDLAAINGFLSEQTTLPKRQTGG
jgi:outer membrane protein